MKKLLFLTLTSMLLSTNMIAQDISQGLIGYWPLNGNANDTLGVKHGIQSGGISYTEDRLGQINNAVHFDNNNHISISGIPTSDQMSFSFWVKINQTQAGTPNVFLDYGNRRTIVNFTSNSQTIRFWCYNSNGSSIWAPQPKDTLLLSKWHHVVATLDWENQLGSFYIDGFAIQENIPVTGTTPAFGGTLYLGSENGNQYFIDNGSMDELKIYDRILSSSEVTQIYSYVPLTTNTGQSLWSSANDDIYYNSGNVGIGTTSPDKKLDVVGSIRAKVDDGTASAIDIDYSSGMRRIIALETGGSNSRPLKIQSQELHFTDDSATRMLISSSGNVGIGTTSPTERLSVDGTVLAKKVRVSVAAADWPDYVFAPSYELQSLSELETYIKQNQHLPEVPSAKAIEINGLDLGKMDATLLKKVEELTLYLIQENKDKDSLKVEVNGLQKENQELKDRLLKIEAILKTLTAK